MAKAAARLLVIGVVAGLAAAGLGAPASAAYRYPHDPLVLALGDSWAMGAHDTKFRGYVYRLKDDVTSLRDCVPDMAIDCRDLQVRDMASPGATTSSLIAERLESAVDLLGERRMDGEKGNEVAVVALTIGGLDAFAPVLAACTTADDDLCTTTTNRVFDTYRSNIGQILEALRTAAGERTRIVATAYANPIGDCYLSGLVDLGDAVLEGDLDRGMPEGLNDITRSVAAEYDVAVAETYGLLGAGDWVGGQDCVHPNSRGHEKIASAFLTALGLEVTRPGHVRMLKQKLTGKRLLLTWRKVRRAEGYQVRITRPGAKKYRKWVATEKRRYRRALKPGKKYRVQIRGVNEDGRGVAHTVSVGAKRSN